MTKEFKVGDKVCHAGFGNGVVQQVIQSPYPIPYPIIVEFKNGLKIFTAVGKFYASDESPSLYHGHGTLKFIPDPEPECTWHWLYLSPYDNKWHVSYPYKSEVDFIKDYGCTPKWYQRIEESKEPA